MQSKPPFIVVHLILFFVFVTNAAFGHSPTILSPASAGPRIFLVIPVCGIVVDPSLPLGTVLPVAFRPRF
jgi:hypothetical protein